MFPPVFAPEINVGIIRRGSKKKEKEARHGNPPCGPWPVQLRFKTRLTSEEYVSRQAWRDASLPHCPLHPRGGCSLARHGTYGRVNPPGTRVSRWYCPQGHRTFSLLPDCFAARFPGSLCAIEQVVVQVEQAESLEAASDRLRPDIDLPGAIRWTRRRVRGVHAALSALRGLHPERFADCSPTLNMFQQSLKRECVLPALREIAGAQLPYLPPPLGFGPWPLPSGGPQKRHQHHTGPDPPR